MSKVNLKKVGVNNPILGDVQRIDENFTDVEVAINDLEDNKASKTYVDGKVKTDVPPNAVFTDTVYDDTELVQSINGKANTVHTHEISDVLGLSDELESSGLTLVNLIENGDFSDGTVGWSLFSGYNSLEVAQGELIATKKHNQLNPQLFPEY